MACPAITMGCWHPSPGSHPVAMSPLRAVSLALILLTGLATPAFAEGGSRRQAETLQAEAAFARSAQIWQQIVSSPEATPQERALALVRLVICLRADGDDGKADALTASLRAINDQALVQGDWTLPRSLLVLAQIEMLRDRRDLAEPLLELGGKLSLAALGADHPLSREFIWALLALAIDDQRAAEPEADEPGGPAAGPSAAELQARRRAAIPFFARAALVQDSSELSP